MADGARMGSAFAGMGANPQNALQQAIEARQSGGQPVPQLSQVTPASPQGQPPVNPRVNAGTPQAVPQGMGQAVQPSSEAELIIKALGQRLSSISAVEKAQVVPPKAQAPQAAPVGGGYNEKK